MTDRNLEHLVEIKSYEGEGYKPVVVFESWRVAVIRYADRFSQVFTIEKHFETDEVFVLVEGDATLCVKEDNEDALIPVKMEIGKIYNVKKGVWHHITVSKDALVLVIENQNTGADNTLRVQHDANN